MRDGNRNSKQNIDLVVLNKPTGVWYTVQRELDMEKRIMEESGEVHTSQWSKEDLNEYCRKRGW